MSGLLSDADAQELIDRLKRSSRYWRPLVAIGLGLVIAGFIVLALALNSRAERAEHVAEVQEGQLRDLNATLSSARRIVEAGYAQQRENSQWQRLARLLRVADRQVETISTGVAASAVEQREMIVPRAEPTPQPATAAGPASELTPTVIRLYLHIGDEQQRPAAERVAAAWSGRAIGNSAIVVPGIELVAGKTDNSLRCTRKDSCAVADQVLAWINASLATPSLHKLDLSARYVDSRKIRPGTFEIWFGPGPIELRTEQD